jgi:hypothetical protein
MVTGLQRTPAAKTAAVAIIEKKVILFVPIFCLLLWFALLRLNILILLSYTLEQENTS